MSDSPASASVDSSASPDLSGPPRPDHPPGTTEALPLSTPSSGGLARPWATAVIGAGLVALAVSGLLDDTGLIPHPWWISLALVAVALCAALAARTVARLISAG